MDIWDIESRISGLTTSCETLDELDLITLDHESHNAYRGSSDVLGLEVPSMELWDESYGPNDGFGFFGGMEKEPEKKKEGKDDSSSSGIQCEETEDSKHEQTTTAGPRVTQVKSVDDYNTSQRPPRHNQSQRQRRYRKRSKQGRYATVDISYDPTNGDSLKDQENNEEIADNFSFQRQTFKTRSFTIVVREDDAIDCGSVNNLFVDRTEGVPIGRASLKHTQHHYLGQESVFPYSFNKTKSMSCGELSPRPPKPPELRHARSRSEVDNVELDAARNTNTKARDRRRRTTIFTASSWINKDSRFKSQSRESLNSFVPDPDKPKDLRTMTNVKVIAIQSYSAQVSHELSFKKGQKLKLKSHSMDGDFGYGWKKLSLIGGKKYGYFPLTHVKLYEKSEK